MQSTILHSANFKTINWPGGTTTQLFIYPPTAEYLQRNFIFRLSTANVNTETSDFTSLPGVSRQLMVLEGETLLIHENHHSKKLGKFDMDEFKGDWKTSSIGRCTDFNLMTKEKASGELSAITIEKYHLTEYQIDKKLSWLFIYAFSGKIRIGLNDGTHDLNQGSLLVIKHPDGTKIAIEGIEKSELIFAEILTKK
ncbi:MAG: HutD family protein [Bacteroidetes bacterium]|nr:HutD family protein [Bacteroidota bacterium]